MGHKTTQGVLDDALTGVTPTIVVQEKLDGANASFRKDGDRLRCYSRNVELDEHNTLRGFYEWAQTNIDVTQLADGYVYYGEWLVRHKLDYGVNGNQFYLFDVYDEGSHAYLGWGATVEAAVKLGINTVTTFYVGPYRGYDHIEQFVGQSDLREQGEGIVVKNYDYRDPYGRQMFVKLVTPDFAEITQQRLPRDPNAPKSPEALFAQTYVTLARVDKAIFRLEDEGKFDRGDIGADDVGPLIRETNYRVYEDLLKEESASLPNGWDDKALKREVGRLVAPLTKKTVGWA